MPAGKKSEKGLNPNLAEMLRFGGGMKKYENVGKKNHGFSREITDICRFFPDKSRIFTRHFSPTFSQILSRNPGIRDFAHQHR
jgi:hypothetical protein